MINPKFKYYQIQNSKFSLGFGNWDSCLPAGRYLVVLVVFEIGISL